MGCLAHSSFVLDSEARTCVTSSDTGTAEGGRNRPERSLSECSSSVIDGGTHSCVTSSDTGPTEAGGTRLERSPNECSEGVNLLRATELDFLEDVQLDLFAAARESRVARDGLEGGTCGR
mmetsp:Transcript_88678/g.264566  ORF Transcript_88678/g.264566 Transcript_88678/m.264566 type:complete len:120 (+) Transcript_88678:157-516(+)